MKIRLIKFRGKRRDNSEWVYGFYFKIDEIHYILQKTLIGMEKHEILPETINQSIGIYDKNGKAIYEGDIVKGCFKTPMIVYFSNGQFKANAIGKDKLKEITLRGEHFGTTEIIGNIYENPNFYNNEKSKYTPI